MAIEDRASSEPRNFTEPRWDGGDLAGKRILIHSEQGLGDTIHISRYMPMLAERGGLRDPGMSDALLMGLFRDLPGLAQIVASGEPLPEFDLYCPIMSLPLMFNTTSATIPWNGPYLHARPEIGRTMGKTNAAATRIARASAWSGPAGRKTKSIENARCASTSSPHCPR